MSLPFLAHGTILSLAWFIAIDLVLSAAAASAASLAMRAGARGSAGFWIAMRLLPAAGATLFVVLVFVPSYWKHEPRAFVEGFGVTLTGAALFAFAVVAASLARGAAAWRSAARRVRAWMRHARPLSICAGVPAFAIEVEQPIIALVGVIRPRLLVTRGLLEALTPVELEAAVAHEVGHLRASDNLKRLLMRAAPDLLAPSSTSRAIEQRWVSAAEHRADRIDGPGAAAAARCALASALVKIARLTPPTVPAAEPISALFAGGDIASRVRALLADGGPEGESRRGPARWAGAAAAVAGLFILYNPLLRYVHEITEIAVRLTP